MKVFNIKPSREVGIIKNAIKDGILDEQERWRLEQLREELGLDSEEALQLLHNVMQQARPLALDKCPHCGESLA